MKILYINVHIKFMHFFMHDSHTFHYLLILAVAILMIVLLYNTNYVLFKELYYTVMW